MHTFVTVLVHTLDCECVGSLTRRISRHEVVTELRHEADGRLTAV